jgi:hypothetical protein
MMAIVGASMAPATKDANRMNLIVWPLLGGE